MWTFAGKAPLKPQRTAMVSEFRLDGCQYPPLAWLWTGSYLRSTLRAMVAEKS